MSPRPDATSSEHAVPDLMSMEDYELENPDIPGPPRRTAHPLRLNKHFGASTASFHDKCQKRGVKAEFKYQEPFQGCFTVALYVDGQLWEQTEDQFASKKDAKEEVCKRNISKLDMLESKKRQQSDADDGLMTLPEDIDSEEWMGLVIQYIQTKKLPHPEINTTGPHPTHGPWCCELRIQDGPTEAFGQHQGPFRTKKVAERLAAREAVLWLRSQGKLPPPNLNSSNTPSAKRRKSSHSMGAEPDSNMRVSQAIREADSSSKANALDDSSVPEHARTIALSLGFSQPTFHFAEVGDSFVDIWAEFNSRDIRYEPRLAGEVGRINHVFGKKAAKTECWREVLKVLEEIRRDRLP